MRISLLKLFLIFVKVGAILLGGGYVILPILITEFVEKRKLITEEELIDYFTLSQSLPGIIAANISMFVGYKLLGKLGAIVAMLGVIFIPFLTIIFLASFITLWASNIYLQSFLSAVGIAVIALICLTVREIWQKTERDSFFYLIFILALVLLLLLGQSPIKTILFILPFGILYKSVFTSKEVK